MPELYLIDRDLEEGWIAEGLAALEEYLRRWAMVDDLSNDKDPLRGPVG